MFRQMRGGGIGSFPAAKGSSKTADATNGRLRLSQCRMSVGLPSRKRTSSPAVTFDATGQLQPLKNAKGKTWRRRLARFAQLFLWVGVLVFRDLYYSRKGTNLCDFLALADARQNALGDFLSMGVLQKMICACYRIETRVHQPGPLASPGFREDGILDTPDEMRGLRPLF